MTTEVVGQDSISVVDHVKKFDCRACGRETEIRSAFKKAGFTVHRCGVCSSLNVDLAGHDPKIIYDDSYYTGSGYADYPANEENIKLNFESRLTEISRHVQRGRALDFGCAYGFFLDLLPSSSFKRFGLEIAANLHERLRGKGIEPLASLDDVPEGTTFDLVTMFDVIEHLEDPLQTLRDIDRHMRPGGVLFIETWDASSLLARALGPKWHAITPPEHIVLFTKAQLMKVLEDLGYTILATPSFGRRLKVKDAVQQLFKIKLSWLGGLSFYYGLGDCLGVLAQKRAEAS